MARHARKQSNSGIYHVMLRGINRQNLFNNDDDLHKMISILSECTEISKVRLHGYCLMTNHVHILVQTGEIFDSETLPQFMKRITIRYAMYYNNKYSRIGSLFQDRYRSEAVETDAYYLAVLRYIHQNPVKAGITKTPSEYLWSSYGNYVGKPDFVYTDMADSMLGEAFKSYMEDAEDVETQIIGLDEEIYRLTDVELSNAIEEALKLPVSIIASLDREARNNALRLITEIKGSTYRQISRLTGLSIGLISTISSM
ncbi:MAG: transposase [Oscillospiraceae bacterium]|nr:transposase [Oscillospiraceae bacterium]